MCSSEAAAKKKLKAEEAQAKKVAKAKAKTKASCSLSEPPKPATEGSCHRIFTETVQTQLAASGALRPIPIYSEEEFQENDVDAQIPCIVENVKKVPNTINVYEDIKGRFSPFIDQFEESPMCKRTGRSQAPIAHHNPAAQKALRDAMYSYQPRSKSVVCPLLDSSNVHAKQVNGCSIFGFVPKKSWALSEHFGFGSLRYQMQGEREIFATSFVKLWAASEGKVLHSWFEQVAEFDAKAWETVCAKDSTLKILRGVVKQGDVIQMPAGFVVFERTINAKPSIGIRASYILQEQKKEFLALLSQMQVSDKTNKNIPAMQFALTQYVCQEQDCVAHPEPHPYNICFLHRNNTTSVYISHGSGDI